MSFIEKIIKSDNKQELLIEKIKNSSKQAIIYGASVYAYVLYKYLTQKGIKIFQFAVDKIYKTSDKYMGIDLISIEEIIPDISNYHVFIGIANYPSVMEKFEKQGINNFLAVDVPDFLNIPNSFMDYEFVKTNESLFQKSYDTFEDELSCNTFIAAINTKINDDLSFIKSYVRPEHLYFSKSEFPISNEETLLDVGGFNGDSIKDFHRISNGNYKKIISLEPFPQIHKKLEDTIREMNISDRCIAVKKGAWNEKTVLSFNNTDMEIDSKITKGGEEKIEVDTIDSILTNLNTNISLIKMDINGAEYNALKGAQKTIQKDKPQIAVKLHVKEDFYRFPVLLKEIAPDIKIYLRQRNYMSMMLVLYGVFK